MISPEIINLCRVKLGLSLFCNARIEYMKALQIRNLWKTERGREEERAKENVNAPPSPMVLTSAFESREAGKYVFSRAPKPGRRDRKPKEYIAAIKVYLNAQWPLFLLF